MSNFKKQAAAFLKWRRHQRRIRGLLRGTGVDLLAVDYVFRLRRRGGAGMRFSGEFDRDFDLMKY